ncbi:uncharacterized protein LOC133330827 [Musca vetustissima]|uniref:uncharacterized protein LOC133330827 n=1 Tax=Musca vetustissima TaxID=27455 RepID=UPI002AB74489|nr:uncharacterized protein LOC133330827 [Musca vetustissima]
MIFYNISFSFQLTSEEANETLDYVRSKYEMVEMKIVGEPISIYGLRLTHGDDEEEINIHFKYIDNTVYDIIQHCVFAIYHRSNECELIRTICNTFLPITPRPLLERTDLRVCDDGNDVQLVEKEDVEDDAENTTTMTATMSDGDGQESRQKQQSAQGANDDDDGDDADGDEEN